MAVEQNLFWQYNILSAIIGMAGIILGYHKISRSLTGAATGYAALKILQFLFTQVLLGVLA